MDEERKNLIVAGVYQGDISLALAGLATELPQYIKDLDVVGLVDSGSEAEAIRAEVEKMPAADSEAKSLPPNLLAMLVERAIAKGKFLSATRCLEMTGEKAAYIDKCLALARKQMGEGSLKEAAQSLVIASNLELNEGTPLFQYTGPALHDACTANREKCVTAVPAEAAVLKAMQYLLEGPKVGEVVGGLTPEARKSLLPYVALARDPVAADFYRGYRQAHDDLEGIGKTDLAALRGDLKRVASELGSLGSSFGSSGALGAEAKEMLERVLRTTSSLRKEFSDIDKLVDELQLKRVGRTVEQLIESRAELEVAATVLKKGSGAGPSQAAAIDRLVALIDELTGKQILETIDAIDEKILSTQVAMLGRKVHSQEHWQYLRELAFKYPVSPLMCCVRRIDNKWMVVHAWNSEIASILRDFLDKQ
jgi:hypothetical protein